MEDCVVRVITETGNLRGVACSATHLVREACGRHRTSPTASVALGRALAGGALMGAMLKGEQRVALKFEGNGPLAKLLVEARSDGSVCGYAGNPGADLPPKGERFDVAGALGRAGLLTVTKDLRLKEPYKGVVPLYSSEIAEDLAYYLTESEQIPSAVGLGVLLGPDLDVPAAGGFLIQALPPSDAKAVEAISTRIRSLPSLGELLRDGKAPEEILAILFGDIHFEILEKRPVFFRCTCSRERMEEALAALGPEELARLAADDQGAEVRCEFCGETYRFERDELEQIAAPLR